MSSTLEDLLRLTPLRPLLYSEVPFLVGSGVEESTPAFAPKTLSDSQSFKEGTRKREPLVETEPWGMAHSPPPQNHPCGEIM